MNFNCDSEVSLGHTHTHTHTHLQDIAANCGDTLTWLSMHYEPMLASKCRRTDYIDYTKSDQIQWPHHTHIHTHSHDTYTHAYMHSYNSIHTYILSWWSKESIYIFNFNKNDKWLIHCGHSHPTLLTILWLLIISISGNWLIHCGHSHPTLLTLLWLLISGNWLIHCGHSHPTLLTLLWLLSNIISISGNLLLMWMRYI